MYRTDRQCIFEPIRTRAWLCDSQIFICLCVAVLSSCGYGKGDLRGFAARLTEGDLSGESYTDFDRHRDRTSGSSFEGFPCLTPCSANAAGYRWAQAQDEISAEDCKRQSWGFTEGCVVYLAEVGAFEGRNN